MSRPLLDAYHTLKAHVPYTPLLDGVTPAEKFNSGATALPELERLWIKRDDRTNAVYGGNKVRKLEFILPDAQAKARIVTIGAIGTNHGVATAIHCKKVGMKCRVLLFDQPLTSTVIHNLKLMIVYGAELHYRGSMMAAGLNYYLVQAVDRHSYFLPPGGSNVLGTVGYVNAAFELRQQIDNGELPEPDCIICPVGSSGTLAGLTLGCQLAGLNCRVRGIRVAPSHVGLLPVCTPHTVAQLMRRTYRYLRGKSEEVPLVRLRDIELDGDYYGEGYGHPSSAGDDAAAVFDKRGITLESTYTAKAAAAVLQFCAAHRGKTVLYWHTFNAAALEARLSDEQLAALPVALRRVLGERASFPPPRRTEFTVK